MSRFARKLLSTRWLIAELAAVLLGLGAFILPSLFIHTSSSTSLFERCLERPWPWSILLLIVIGFGVVLASGLPFWLAGFWSTFGLTVLAFIDHATNPAGKHQLLGLEPVFYLILGVPAMLGGIAGTVLRARAHPDSFDLQNLWLGG